MSEYVNSLSLEQIGQILGGVEVPYSIDPNQLYSDIAERLNSGAGEVARKRNISVAPEDIRRLVEDSPQAMGMASRLVFMGYNSVVTAMVRQRDPSSVSALERFASQKPKQRQ